MEWNIHYLTSIPRQLLSELLLEVLLVLLSVLWLLLRLLGVAVKRVEQGNLVHVRILGRELIEVGAGEHRAQQGKEEIVLEEESDTRKTGSRMSSTAKVRRGS